MLPETLFSLYLVAVPNGSRALPVTSACFVFICHSTDSLLSDILVWNICTPVNSLQATYKFHATVKCGVQWRASFSRIVWIDLQYDVCGIV